MHATFIHRTNKTDSVLSIGNDRNTKGNCKCSMHEKGKINYDRDCDTWSILWPWLYKLPPIIEQTFNESTFHNEANLGMVLRGRKALTWKFSNELINFFVPINLVI